MHKTTTIIIIVFFFVSQAFSQSFVNDGASIMLQLDAVVFSDNSFLNKNNGQIQGDGTMDFALATNQAVLNPGIAIGNLSFMSNLENTLSAGFMLDIEGTSGIGLEDGNDHVFIDGDLMLDGELSIATIDAFNPEPTDAFVLITYTGNLSGQFSFITLGPNLTDFTVDYSVNGLIRLVHNSTLGIEDVEEIKDLHIYPNPTSNFIYLRATSKINKVEIYDMLGKKVLQTNQTEKINLSFLAKGLYFVRVFNANTWKVKKINVK